MKRRKRLPGGTLGELEEVLPAGLTATEIALFDALAELDAQREADKVAQDLALAELAESLLGGNL